MKGKCPVISKRRTKDTIDERKSFFVRRIHIVRTHLKAISLRQVRYVPPPSGGRSKGKEIQNRACNAARTPTQPNRVDPVQMDTARLHLRLLDGPTEHEQKEEILNASSIPPVVPCSRSPPCYTRPRPSAAGAHAKRKQKHFFFFHSQSSSQSCTTHHTTPGRRQSERLAGRTA
jgi:hypothetical protein